MQSVEQVSDDCAWRHLAKTVGDECIDKGVKSVIRFVFWMNIVMILLASDGFLLFHFDGCEVVYDLFKFAACVLIPRQD